jgi:hypothetical protein
MLRNKDNQPLLSHEASIRYWKDAVTLAKANGEDKMTIQHFSNYLNLIDEEAVQTKCDKVQSQLTTIHRDEQAKISIDEAWEQVKALSKYDGIFTATHRVKSNAIKRLNPQFKDIPANDMPLQPDYWKYTATGTFIKHPVKYLMAMRRWQQR